MNRNAVWYACQMFLYELRLAWRVEHRDSAPKAPNKTTISVPWEIKK